MVFSGMSYVTRETCVLDPGMGCAKKKILLLPCGPGHGMDRALLGRVQQTEEEMRVLLDVASRSGGHLIAGEWKCLPGSAVHHPIPSRKKTCSVSKS
jgi:hypothetical protein